MSIEQVIKCDGCGNYLKSTKEAFHLDLKTERFWDGIENDYFHKKFDFCSACASKIKEILIKISKEKKNGK